MYAPSKRVVKKGPFCIIDFIARQRIKKACSLLESTEMPACRVAAACGFSSASAFNAVFRRQTGTTPLDWRHTQNTAR